MHADPGRQLRQHFPHQELDVAARLQLVARIDEQDVPGPQVIESLLLDLLNGPLQKLNRQTIDARARLGIDRGDAGPESAVGDSAGQKARRMARADLDDAPRGRLRTMA